MQQRQDAAETLREKRTAENLRAWAVFAIRTEEVGGIHLAKGKHSDIVTVIGGTSADVSPSVAQLLHGLHSAH